MLTRFAAMTCAVALAAMTSSDAQAQDQFFYPQAGCAQCVSPVNHSRMILPAGCVNGACGVSTNLRCVPGVGCYPQPTTICTPAGCYTSQPNHQTVPDYGVRYLPAGNVNYYGRGSVIQNGGQLWPNGTRVWQAWPNGSWVPGSSVVTPQPATVPQPVRKQPHLVGTPYPGSLSRDPFFP